MPASEANQPSDAWQARYAAAQAMLASPAQMAVIGRMVAQVTDGAPAVAVVGGARLLLARRVGMLAGSYNPLTRAHIALAEAARQTARLDAIVWACSAVTVNKEQVTRAGLPNRLAQLAAYLAATQSAALAPPPAQTQYAGAQDDHHANRDALVILNHGLYVEQAQALRTLLAIEAELTIIVGFDKVVQIFDPRYYADRAAALQALFAQARLLVAPRDGQGEAALAALLARHENQPYAPYVTYCPLAPEYATDSSSEARQIAAPLAPAAIAASPELRRLLPPEGVALAQTGAYAEQA